MRIIAAINMAIDGFCDHTGFEPDAEIHQHYTALLTDADAILYGRITYQLMQYWQPMVNNPSGEKSMDDFATAIDGIPKIVFSNTLKDVEWDSAQLAKQSLEDTVLQFRQQSVNDVLIGSRSLIVQLLNLNLIDELQLCVHPVIAGKGLPLFENINQRKIHTLVKTKIFSSGAIILYYQRI